MTRQQFLDLVRHTIATALEQEGVQLSDTEKRFLRYVVGWSEKRMTTHATDTAAEMDKAQMMLEARMHLMIELQNGKSISEVMSPDRVRQILGAMQKHWFEIRRCGEVYDAELRAREGRRNRS